MKGRVKAFLWLAVSALLAGIVSAGEYQVATAHEGICVNRYGVSEDGGTWRLIKTIRQNAYSNSDMGIPANGTIASVTSDGEVLYIGVKFKTGDSSWIERWSPEGECLGIFKDLQSVCRLDSITIDPNREWIYVSVGFGDTDAKKGKVYRYRLDDPSIGGAYISGLSTPRQVTFGPDGTLYVACRGINGVGACVKAYDVSGETPDEKYSYAGGNQGGVAVDSKYVYLLYNKSYRQYPVGDVNNFKDLSFSDGSNGFSSLLLRDKLLVTREYGGGKISRILSDGSSTNLVQITGGLSGLCEIATPSHRWTFEEGKDAACFYNVVNTNTCKIYNYGRARAGVQGVKGEGLWIDNESSCCTIMNSTSALPTSGNFSIFFWVGIPDNSYTGERILFSSNNGQDTRTAFAINFGDVGAGKLAFFHPAGLGNNKNRIASTSRIDDGKWHYVGAVRRENVMELWVDGVMEDSHEDKGLITLGSNQNWFIGGMHTCLNCMRNGFMDELRFYNFDVKAEDIKGIYKYYAPNGATELLVPTKDGLEDPEVNDAVAAKYGTVLTHSFLYDFALTGSTMTKTADGTLWAGCCYNNKVEKNNTYTLIFKSTDNGETWQTVSTNKTIGGGALFADQAGRLCIVGPQLVFNGWNINVGTSSDGITWENTDFGYYWAALVGGRVIYHNDLYWYCTSGNSFSFGYQNKTKQKNVFRAGWSSPFPSPSLGGTRYSGVLYAKDNQVQGLFPYELQYIGGMTYSPGYVDHANITRSDEAMTMIADEGFTLPGGSKKFDMVYDETTKRYWAVVMPEVNINNGALPNELNNVIALYSSEDLRTWLHHTDIVVATQGEVGFNSPQCLIVGNDLHIVFLTAAKDGAGWRDINEANFMLYRKLANFRDYDMDETYYKDRYLLISDTYGNGVNKYYPKDSGGFVYGGCFIPRGTYGGFPFTNAYSIKANTSNVYVGEINATNILEFTRNGEFIRVVADFSNDKSQIDQIMLSRDGKYLYCSDMLPQYQQCIWRVDLKTLEKVKWIQRGNEMGIAAVRGMAEMPDGRIAVLDRLLNKLFILNADATLDKVLADNLAYPQALEYDEINGVFYVGSTNGGRIYKIHPTTGNRTEVAYRPAFSFAKLGNKWYDADWGNGTVCETFPDVAKTTTGKNTYNVVIVGKASCCRMVGVEIPRGTVIMLR